MVDVRRVALVASIATASCGALLNGEDPSDPGPTPPGPDAAPDDAVAPEAAVDANADAGVVVSTIGFFERSSSRFELRFANASGVGNRTVVIDGGVDKGAWPFAGHWNSAHSPDTIGYFVGGDSPTFHFFGQFGVGETVEQFGFSIDGGSDEAMPVVGDWNGDGICTVGFYVRSTGTFFLKDTNAPGNADYMFPFAAPGGLPVVGDWDGDGVDGIGVFFPDNGAVEGHFFLKNALGPGNADVTFNVSTPGTSWFPLAGDWDGDGRATVGLYDSVRAEFRLFEKNVDGATMSVFAFGPAGALPIAGKWQR